jgi:polysaccharide export outer membrane protein
MKQAGFARGIWLRKRGICLAFALFVAATPASAAQQEPTTWFRPTAADTSTYFLEPYPYRIGPGDQLFVDYGVLVEGNQVTIAVLVKPDGTIDLPYVGEVRVSGFSTVAVDTLLAHLYARVYVNARITTAVREVAGNLVHVMGEVERPGSYPVLPNGTALQAVAQAGGFRKEAARGDVLVIRRTGPTEVAVKKLNLKDLLSKHQATADVMVRRFDIVYVNRSMIGDINSFLTQFLQPLSTTADAYNKAWTIVNIDRVFPNTQQSNLRP